MKPTLLLVAVLAILGLSAGQWNPNYATGRTTMVHLFEWKFVRICNFSSHFRFANFCILWCVG